MGEQPPSKPRYVPKPPKRKGGKLKRSKVSSYDWEMAREEMMMAVASLSWTVCPVLQLLVQEEVAHWWQYYLDVSLQVGGRGEEWKTLWMG